MRSLRDSGSEVEWQVAHAMDDAAAWLRDFWLRICCAFLRFFELRHGNSRELFTVNPAKPTSDEAMWAIQSPAKGSLSWPLPAQDDREGESGQLAGGEPPGPDPQRSWLSTWSLRDLSLATAWWTGVVAFTFFALVPSLHAAQNLLSLYLLIVLITLYLSAKRIRGQRTTQLLRLAIILINVFLSSRYIYWRATETLPLQFGIASAFFGLLLFLAELYGFINSTMGCFINSDPKTREPIPLPLDQDRWPHVDVYIPTYNESAIVVGPTVIAATQMSYPSDKLHVFILDDGGTEQKLNDQNPEKARDALERATTLKQIAEQFGAGYITRKRNQHAKAGNINNALKATSSELLLILDCDHIPTEDFLLKTVGFFAADPKLFLVQTPHNFVSPDPITRNLGSFSYCPAENELFYDVIQPGLDNWGTSFFCGSAALLRRRVLDELGGIAGQTITEDAETTMDALALGYTTAYYSRPMVSGLQPETYAGFILQRVRWGQGMLQIFMLKNVWLQHGMNFVQRILYTNFAVFWGFATARLVMLLAPPLFLLFGVNLCDTSADDLLAYAVPTLIASLISTQYFYGKVRWPFISQLYEILQSVYVTQGIAEVIRHPRAPSFKVTPKGETLDQDTLSSLARPFYFLLALNFAGIFYGVVRYFTSPWSHGAIILVEFWAVVDFFLLLCALGITFERRQMRAEPRVARLEPVCVHGPHGAKITGFSSDVSASGAGIVFPTFGALPFQPGDVLSLEFTDRGVALGARTLSTRPATSDHTAIGVRYLLSTTHEARVAVSIAFGSSEVLMQNNESRHAGRSILYGLVYVLRVGLTLGGDHVRELARDMASSGLQRLRRLVWSHG